MRLSDSVLFHSSGRHFSGIRGGGGRWAPWWASDTRTWLIPDDVVIFLVCRMSCICVVLCGVYVPCVVHVCRMRYGIYTVCDMPYWDTAYVSVWLTCSWMLGAIVHVDWWCWRSCGCARMLVWYSCWCTCWCWCVVFRLVWFGFASLWFVLFSCTSFLILIFFSQLLSAVLLLKGNLKHLPFFGAGETWDTYEARFEEALAWLQVSEFFELLCEGQFTRPTEIFRNMKRDSMFLNAPEKTLQD